MSLLSNCLICDAILPAISWGGWSKYVLLQICEAKIYIFSTAALSMKPYRKTQSILFHILTDVHSVIMIDRRESIQPQPPREHGQFCSFCSRPKLTVTRFRKDLRNDLYGKIVIYKLKSLICPCMTFIFPFLRTKTLVSVHNRNFGP